MVPSRFLPQLLLWYLLLRQEVTGVGAADTLRQCSGLRETTRCTITGHLGGACPRDATSLVLQFSGGAAASWPEEGGLTDCEAVSHLKVTGWSGPELASGHLRQLGAGLTSADIVDGGLERVGANVTTGALVELSLARNKIATIHEMALTECRSLTSLDLSDNSIERLPDRFLAGCGALRSLRLNGNRLTELRPAVLLGANQLRDLLLQRNRFQMLDKVELGFGNSRRLSLIDMRNNGLLSYQPGRRGFCGPANVTVRMHFAGCPPSQSEDCGDSNPDLQRRECVGSSANLLVTFTSCQVGVDFRCRPQPRALPAPAAQPAPTCPTAAAPTAFDKFGPTADVRLLTQLGVAREGAWLVYALAAAVIFAVLQLIVSLAVCHRLKLRLARLQVRAERLADECPSHHRFFQHPALCSESALSDRLTPSGKGPSSQCGYSQWGETPTLPKSSPPLPPPPLPPPPLPLPPLQQQLPLLTDPADGSDETIVTGKS